MIRLFAPRVVFAGIAAACVALIGFALYLQNAKALEPCPLCILQRYAFIAVGVVALAAAIHGPRGLTLKIYGVLTTLFAVAGAGVAARHSWLQHFPGNAQSCGADLDYLLSSLPLSRALPAIFRGTGACSDIQWSFLGLSIPEWALVWFTIFAAIAAAVTVKTYRSGARS